MSPRGSTVSADTYHKRRSILLHDAGRYSGYFVWDEKRFGQERFRNGEASEPCPHLNTALGSGHDMTKLLYFPFVTGHRKY